LCLVSGVPTLVFMCTGHSLSEYEYLLGHHSIHTEGTRTPVFHW
jgi:hypothetical protein